MGLIYFTIVLSIVGISTIVTAIIANKKYKEREKQYLELETAVLSQIGLVSWHVVSFFDEYVAVKSAQQLRNYEDITFFKENKDKLAKAKKTIDYKIEISKILKSFLNNNEYTEHPQYGRIVYQVNKVIENCAYYRIKVSYTSPTGRSRHQTYLCLDKKRICFLQKDPTSLMSKREYNQYLKEKQQEELNQKQHKFYERVNQIIDYANTNRETLFIKGSRDQLDSSIAQLFDRTVNSIKKIKNIDSEEWDIINNFIIRSEADINKIVSKNQKFVEFYNSDTFQKIKETCETLTSAQKEFNEYITEKVQSISQLLGSRIVRNETINNDEYQYIRPYKKTITPFTAEVSAAVFASAENNPIDYVIKNFYPNKAIYPEQIQKLHLLVEELATLKDARNIIENYKKDYHQYLRDVPSYIMDEDEAGFYSRLGFANIDESVLVVEYKFSYTSGGGMAKRTFTIPMTEETIVQLIEALEGKLTASTFTKEQRALMTNKLREFIKKRDNFTCCSCGNSIHIEPNLLLEIDHIIPVSKGGCTVEDNLQTLCWKCNRSKSNKMTNLEAL